MKRSFTLQKTTVLKDPEGGNLITCMSEDSHILRKDLLKHLWTKHHVWKLVSKQSLSRSHTDTDKLTKQVTKSVKHVFVILFQFSQHQFFIF